MGFVLNAPRILDVEITLNRLAGLDTECGTTLTQIKLPAPACLDSQIDAIKAWYDWQNRTLELDRSRARFQAKARPGSFGRQLCAKITAGPVKGQAKYGIGNLRGCVVADAGQHRIASAYAIVGIRRGKRDTKTSCWFFAIWRRLRWRLLIAESNFEVFVNNRARSAVHEHAAAIEKNCPVTKPVDRGQIMRNENDGPSVAPQRGDAIEALGLKGYVTHRKNFVEQNDVRLKVRGNGEAESHIHSRGIAFHRHIDVFFEPGELDDAVHLRGNLGSPHAQHRAVKVDVFPASEFGMKTGADLNQGCEPASNLDLPFGWRRDARQEFEEGRLSRTVVSDDAENLSLTHFEADVAQGPHLLRIFGEGSTPSRR